VFAAPLATMTLIAGAGAISTVLRESGVSEDVAYRVSAVGRFGSLLLPFGFLAGLALGRRTSVACHRRGPREPRSAAALQAAPATPRSRGADRGDHRSLGSAGGPIVA
jgi:hypothetical protein